MVDFFCLTEKKIHAFIDKKTYCSDRILNTVLASVMGGLEGFNFSYKPCNLNIFRSDYLEKYTRDNLKPSLLTNWLLNRSQGER